MQLYIKPMCFHKSPFSQSFLTNFIDILHYQPSLFNLTTARTFTSISVTTLSCKWNFHLHNFHRRPNNKAQACRMFVQNSLTGGAFFERVSGGGRPGNGDHCRELHIPTLEGHDPSSVCESCRFLLHSKTQHEKKMEGVGWAPKIEEVLELKYLPFFGCCIIEHCSSL